jgi:hypothetical protein
LMDRLACRVQRESGTSSPVASAHNQAVTPSG